MSEQEEETIPENVSDVVSNAGSSDMVEPRGATVQAAGVSSGKRRNHDKCEVEAANTEVEALKTKLRRSEEEKVKLESRLKEVGGVLAALQAIIFALCQGYMSRIYVYVKDQWMATASFCTPRRSGNGC